ncbi:sensor histidine kinase [Dongia sp.]|uniref:sensor histidine kinase n=1 Tax=Dongia sp. TaxID=1977262 RepID=UPI0035B3B366
MGGSGRNSWALNGTAQRRVMLGSRREQWMALVPAAAILLVLGLLGALLWFMDRQERDAKRITLINDALWVEQALRFAIQSDQDDLAQLAFEISHGLPPQIVRDRFEHIVRNSPEIAELAWRDAAGATQAAIPGSFAELEAAPASASGRTRELAVQTGKSQFSPAFKSAERRYLMELAIPLYRDVKPAGLLIAHFSLDALLASQVPWWVAQQYQVTFENQDGETLARKSQSMAASGLTRHAILFDPPGGGLLLTVEPFNDRTDLAGNALIAAIVWFSLLAIASLIVTRSNMKRRSLAEAALREEHAFRKAMEESLTVGMRARDLDGRIIYVNPSFCNMTGFSEKELIGRTPPMPYWVPEDMDRTMELHRMVLDGRAPSEGFEIKFQRRNGERFDALVYEAPLIDAEGRHCGWMASVVDITERKLMEDMSRQQNEKLAQTARLVTMGEMASTLAHELNQPLAAISSYATGSMKRLETEAIPVADLNENFGKISAQAQRAGQIIRRVRAFVRKSEPKFEVLDMDELIADTLDFVAADLKARHVTVDFTADRAIAKCRGDQILLEQVLLNLVRNAIEAMARTVPHWRMLTIRRHQQGDEIVVSIADRGPGIGADISASLFVPFATTKTEGMGMGLNICRTIVELHRGRIWFENRPEGGAIFLFSVAAEDVP